MSLSLGLYPDLMSLSLGLYGKTHLEALRIDEVVYLVSDVRLVWAQVHQEKNPTKKVIIGRCYEPCLRYTWFLSIFITFFLYTSCP